MSQKPTYKRAVIRVRRPDARANARPRKVLVRHAAESGALRLGRFDLRSTMGKEYRSRVQALVEHLGGPDTLSAPQRTLVDRAARLGLIVETSWHELAKTGAFRNGEPLPALAAFRSALADERSLLAMLGLERKTKVVPDLDEYIAARRKRLPFKEGE